MADEYKSVLAGGLSLKGGLFKNKKKKNKRKREETEATLRAKESVSQDDGPSGSSEDRIESAEADASERGTLREKSEEENMEGVEDMLTPAQRRFRSQQIARESKKIRSMVEKTHRERVEEFNALLASMTEHNDIPRCSAAGNG